MTMNADNSPAEYIARCVLECEAKQTVAAKAPPLSLAYEKLRRYMTKFVGADGFEALCNRALVLATSEAKWLESVQMSPDHTLTVFYEAAKGQEPPKIQQGEQAFLTQLFDLLVAFIGEAMTLEIVREVWPTALPDKLTQSAKELTV